MEKDPLKSSGLINEAKTEPLPDPADTIQTAAPSAPDSPAPQTVEAPPSAPPANQTPVKSEVDPNKGTVAGQMQELNAKGSAYTNLAENDTWREANSRGMINSVMSKAAGREAAIRASLPIAQQDANTYNDARIRNQEAENRFRENEQTTYLNIERDKNSAALNERLATLESNLSQNEMELEYGLKSEMEAFLQSERFSDDAKLRVLEDMSQVVQQTQQQITEIGLSDRSAAAQAQAIKLAEAQRNAQLKVYKKMLKSFDDWDWSTDIIPKNVKIPKVESGGSGNNSNTTSGSVRPPGYEGGGGGGTGVGGGDNHGGPTGGGGSGKDGR